jgi:hypothetical protein
LTLCETWAYSPSRLLMRGPRLEAILTWSSLGQRHRRCGAARGSRRKSRSSAAPARRFAPSVREALGARPHPLRGAAFNGWTRRRRWEAKASREDKGVKSPASCAPPGSTGPGNRNRRKLERRMASAATRTAARRTLKECAVRRSSPSLKGAKERGPARGRHKKRAMTRVWTRWKTEVGLLCVVLAITRKPHLRPFYNRPRLDRCSGVFSYLNKRDRATDAAASRMPCSWGIRRMGGRDCGA